MVDNFFEEWKPIPRYDGKYEASSLGRIRNALTRQIYKQTVNAGGYLTLGACHQGKRATWLVHRLIMEAFHGPSGLDVDHIDAVRDNNRLTNLRYCTDTENNRAMIDRNIDNYAGAHRNGRSKRWRSTLNLYLGTFDTKEEARSAWIEARKRYYSTVTPS